MPKNITAIFMQRLGQRYAQYINRTYQRSGTLWERRFKSCLAQSEQYVLSCYRYIELNPLRAKLVSNPVNYRWSSYSANAHGFRSELITHHPTYKALGFTSENRQQVYQALFNYL